MPDISKKPRSSAKRLLSRRTSLLLTGIFLTAVLALSSLLCLPANAAEVNEESAAFDELSLPSDSEESSNGDGIDGEDPDMADSSDDPDESCSDSQDTEPEDGIYSGQQDTEPEDEIYSDPQDTGPEDEIYSKPQDTGPEDEIYSDPQDTGPEDEIYSDPQDTEPRDEYDNYTEAEAPSAYAWPESGIVTRIPVPDCALDNLWINDEMPGQFFANADVAFSFFESYLNLCKDLGYIFDETESSSDNDNYISYRYQAYDSEGYFLELSYIGNADTGTGGMDFFKNLSCNLGFAFSKVKLVKKLD